MSLCGLGGTLLASIHPGSFVSSPWLVKKCMTLSSTMSASNTLLQKISFRIGLSWRRESPPVLMDSGLHSLEECWVFLGMFQSVQGLKATHRMLGHPLCSPPLACSRVTEVVGGCLGAPSVWQTTVGATDGVMTCSM